MINIVKRIIAIVFCILIAGMLAATLGGNFRSIGHTLLHYNDATSAPESAVKEISKLIKTFEQAINDEVAFKPFYMNLFGMTQKALGYKRILDHSGSNSIYLLANNQLVFRTGEILDIDEYAEKLVALSRKVLRLAVFFCTWKHLEKLVRRIQHHL